MDLGNHFVYFLDEESFIPTKRPGFRRRIVTGDGLQLCFWRIAGGASGSVMHVHPDNEQLGIVARGKLDFRIGEDEPDKRVVLGQGDVYLVPKGVPHGESIFIGDDEFDECWILDVFAPPRPDLIEGG